MNYSKWSPALLKVEREFYKSFDPRIWFLAALQFDKAIDVEMKIEYENPTPKAIPPTQAEDLLSDFPSTRRLFLRQFRYQASEVLLSMMLSTETNWPYVRFATKTKADKLNSLFLKVASASVPYQMRVTESSVDLSFNQWVKFALTGQVDAELCETIVPFIQQEAKLVADRSTINAMKHGRAAVDLNDGDFKFQIRSDGDFKNVISPSPVVTYFKWVEQQEGPNSLRFEMTRGLESVDDEYDVFAIHTASILMNLMKRSRLSMLGVPQSERISPDNVQLQKAFFRVDGLPVIEVAT